MKKLFPLVWLVLGSAWVQAQFYAPETEFHDRSQRTFAVEAARVLAWRQNAGGAKIAEVTYQQETTAGRETIWRIQWLDGAKAPVREKTVRYPESLLVTGPQFYREVFRQLAGEDWLPKAASAPTAAVVDREFWEGAQSAGVSRLEALAEAGRLIPAGAKVESAAQAARISATLVHGCLPSMANALTVDAMLLSRSATWLCLAEQMAGTPDEGAWAPVLFLSGREPAARVAWEKTPAPREKDRGDAGRLWELLLHTPSTKDCFLFAARAENNQFGFSAMMYPTAFDREWMNLLVKVSDDMLGDGMIARLYEYGPNVSIRGAVGGGHWGSRQCGVALARWIQTLAAFQPSPQDYTGYQAAMMEAVAAVKAADKDGETAITAFAPVMNQGLEEGVGPLIPVATVTARDLLGYGWEMGGLQLGYTHNFLAKGLGDPGGAAAIAKPALEGIKGIEVFFRDPKVTPRSTLSDLSRLQYVTSSRVDAALLQSLPESWKSNPLALQSRCWLVRGGNVGIQAMVRGGAKPEELRPQIERMRAEGGPLAVCNLVNHDVGDKVPAIIDSLDLRASLLAEMPWTYYERATLLYDRNVKKKPFDQAVALEKLGWEHLIFPNHNFIFNKYIVANAEESAKRFYDQVQPFITNRVDFSATTGPARYALAWIEGDEPMMRQAIQDCSTYSYSDLNLQAEDAIIHGGVAQAERFLDALVARYNSKSAPLLRAWLPQLPAFLDRQHAGHKEAIESFPPGNGTLFLRWALARQAQLPPEDTDLLFHNETTGTEGIFAAAARGDKEHFKALYTQVDMYTMLRVIISHELFKVYGYKPIKDQPDLKPAGARPLDALVREELQRR